MENSNYGKMGGKMGGLILKITFIICLFSINSCITLNKKIEHIITPTKNTVVVTNNNNFPVAFNLKVNDLFPLDSTDILNLVNNDTSASAAEEKAWNFVQKNTFFSFPFSSENWQHNPFIFLNSLGAGFCDDNASLLASVWQFQNKKSRIMGIEGHVVPEVFTNNKWCMYDASSNVFYLNRKKEVCSVEELALDTNLFYDKNGFINNVQPHNFVSGRIFAPYYFSTKDNKDVTDWHLNYPKITNEFILPSYSSLHLTLDSISGITSISIHLSKKSKGILKIPLVPHSSSGKFSYRYKEKTTKVASNYIFPNSDFYGTILIEKVNSSTEINYLINPKLTCLKQLKKVKILTCYSLKITEKQSYNKTKILYGDFDHMIDCQVTRHTNKLNELSKYSANDITKEFILQHYVTYLKDEKIPHDKYGELVDKLSKQIDSFDNERSALKFLKLYYPRSLILAYIVNTYDKYEGLIPYLNSIKKL